jgi:hypothetical protein
VVVCNIFTIASSKHFRLEYDSNPWSSAQEPNALFHYYSALNCKLALHKHAINNTRSVELQVWTTENWALLALPTTSPHTACCRSYSCSFSEVPEFDSLGRLYLLKCLSLTKPLGVILVLHMDLFSRLLSKSGYWNTFTPYNLFHVLVLLTSITERLRI